MSASGRLLMADGDAANTMRNAMYGNNTAFTSSSEYL
jgi:hypothetical protein